MQVNVKKFLFFVLFFSTIPIITMQNLILISAPGSGKGTLSQYLIKKYGYVQICPGDIFRDEINRETELGKKIRPLVESGAYVEEPIVCNLIADNMEKTIKENKPFIIDGFPRSEFSYQFLYEILCSKSLLKNTCFLQLMVSDQACIKRILGRLICSICAKVYNNDSAQPQKFNRCDDCETKLSARIGDTEAVVVKRLEYFHKNIEPLLKKATQQYKVRIIQAECPINELHQIYDSLPLNHE